MKVYKFGGASVKDAAGIKNLARIVSSETAGVVVVISAFGKTTNSLEKVLESWYKNDRNYPTLLNEVYETHLSIIEELFKKDQALKGKIDISFALLKEYLSSDKKGKYDFEYDQIVSYGELWSTIIVEAYLKKTGSDSVWNDIRESVKVQSV
jgi:aspartate kinase